jgi:hypothetical protein
MPANHTLTERATRSRTRLPWLRKLLGYSFLFFLLKGLAWTALLAYPLMKGLQ